MRGTECVPVTGPVVLAARHYHHLLDAAAIIAITRRPVHCLVAVDWVHSRAERWLFEMACRAARWPMVLRRDALRHSQARFGPGDRRRYARNALRLAASILADGGILLVFPEGHPVIDPEEAAPRDATALRPFRSGIERMVAGAHRLGAGRVSVVPVGIDYQRDGMWKIDMRIGAPHTLEDHPAHGELTAALRRDVAALSGLGRHVELESSWPGPG
ncbi:MAG: 1-acyl-sn-glycerol-3-phosphate acyltransferase [Chloroflexota bacterium]